MDIDSLLEQRYRVIGTLGAGGFGIVYAANDIKTGKMVAIKECVSAAETEYMKLFSNVPGIVPIISCFMKEEKYYCVMPQLLGGTLREYREQRKKFSQEQCLKLLYPVILGLQTVHNAGVIHRDISPDNLLFDESGDLFLIDFGAAVKYEDMEILRKVPVRHGYAPPEQYSLMEKQGPWSDIYAMCAVIYYMMTGADPLPAIDRARKNKLLTLKELGMTSNTFSDIVEQGMELDYHKRYQNLNELIETFESKMQFF